MSFSPNNQFLATAGLDEHILIWSLKDKRIIKAFKKEEEFQGLMYDLDWSHDGSFLAAGIQKSVLILDVRNLSNPYN